MPNFPSQDLTNKIISQSYQNLLQQFPDGATLYILDGLGNEVFSVNSAGTTLLTNVDTASYAVESVSSLFSDTSSYALDALSSTYSDTSSVSDNSISSVSILLRYS